MKKLITIIAILVAFASGCKKTDNKDTTNSTDTTNTNNNTNVDTTHKHTYVVISTNYGEMTLTLYDETPKHKENFLKLVKAKYYDSTLFHRVIFGFMIQGGDPDSKTAVSGQSLGSGGPGYTIPAEFVTKLIHKRGALAAARQGDNLNPKKASSGSQFYIVHGGLYTDLMLNSAETAGGFKYTAEQRDVYKKIGGTAELDYQYTVFGEVISGLDVITKIASVKTDKNNRPLVDIRVTVKIIEK